MHEEMFLKYAFRIQAQNIFGTVACRVDRADKFKAPSRLFSD